MSTTDGTGQHTPDDEREDLDDEEDFDPAEYNSLIELDRLESLEEEMNELGVSSLDDIRRRIAELSSQLDAEHKG